MAPRHVVPAAPRGEAFRQLDATLRRYVCVYRLRMCVCVLGQPQTTIT
jgi:hypothetical protein